MAEREFWQLAYLVALHKSGVTEIAARAADKAVEELVKRHGKETRH